MFIIVICAFLIFLYLRNRVVVGENEWYSVYYILITVFGLYIWTNIITWPITDCTEGNVESLVSYIYYEGVRVLFCQLC